MTNAAPRDGVGNRSAAMHAAQTAPATVAMCSASPIFGCTLSVPHDPHVTTGETTLREKFRTMLLISPA